MFVAGCGETLSGPQIAALVIVSGTGQSGAIGSLLSQPFVVLVQDQDGQPVEGVVVSWEVVSGGGVISPSTSTSDASGQATATLRLGTTIGTNTVAASINDATGILFSATATAAPPTRLTIAGGDAQSGVVATQLPVDLSVRVSDAVDNPKAGVTVSFAVTSGGGTLNTASAVTDASGIATVRWTLGSSAGPQSAIASVTGLTAVSFTATALAGSPDALTILSGNNQSGSPGTALPDSLRVRLLDKFGNPIAGVTIAWAPTAGSGTVSPTSSVTDANGRAATRWTLGSTGGPKTVVATGGGFSQSFTGGGNVLYLSVAAGGRHSCGLAQGGVAYCWGYNGDGQLGVGQPPAGSGPVFAFPQPSGTTGNLTFLLLTTGRFHSCGLTLAGVGYCWGANVDGRLGIGTAVAANTPTAVVANRAYSALSAGQTHSCSLDLAGGAFCWGSNTNGQLGLAGGPAVLTPSAVSGGMAFLSVSAGGLHSCAVSVALAAWCWGDNTSGQLGDASNLSTTAPVAVAGGIAFAAVAAGNQHSCGLSSGGVPYCWGSNASGQLGTGAGGNSNVPIAVVGGLVFTSITSGQSHSCGLTGAGALYCWGANTKGQLGDGSTTNRAVPTLVLGGLTFRAVGAGDAHTCAVTTGNLAYCWGDNEYGQLGDGSTTMRLSPVRVAFQP